MILYLKSDFAQYACHYETHGFSYIRPLLYIRRSWVPYWKYLPFKFKWKLVWVEGVISKEEFLKHTRENRIAWFYRAIHQREAWLREWHKQSQWETNEGDIK